MSTQDLVSYYCNLLIKQYLGKPKARATIQAQITPVLMPQVTVQTVTFTSTPTSGNWVLSYGSQTTSSLAHNISASALQTALQLLTGLGSVTVTGSITTGFTITFLGVPPVALLLEVSTNTLSPAVVPQVTETDMTLPLAVQNAFNLTGPNIAVGVQLDTLGKYAGVSRNGYGTGGQPIALGDSDYLTLIQMKIATNNQNASLETIQNYLYTFFPNQVFVYDYQDMRLSYVISSSIGSTNLVEMMITNNLLPRPTGVQISSTTVIPDPTKLFCFRTYRAACVGTPFNTYSSYNLTWKWLTYGEGV